MSIADVRLLAVWEDDPTESPLTIDLRVDRPAGRLIGRWSLFGAVDLDGPHCAPFILKPDGAIDFGADRHPDREWRTDLRDVQIRVGQTFTLHWNEQDHAIYRIEKLAVLGSKET